MKFIRKRKRFLLLIVTVLCLTGCGNNKIKNLAENVKKMELTGNLVTYQAYFHNVIEYDKKADSGLFHLFEKDRKLFAEYTGTIKLGIDLSNVKIEVNGNKINVKIPNAKIIGSPDVDRDDFNSEKFIENEDGINKNPITLEDSNSAFEKAQENMRQSTAENEELLSIAQKRAKVILEENIKQFSGISENKYTINWEYETN